MTDLIPILLVAGLGVLGNIFYFEYQSNKRTRNKVLQERLTNLLLPLYYAFMDDDFRLYWEESHDHEAGKPQRLGKKLNKIIEKNLYLADDELHEACLNFLEWSCKSDEVDRFQRAHIEGLGEDKVFNDFRKIVERKYTESRHRYLAIR